ncbi:MAG: hypothetical protein JST85_23030 [Acidobacteria bacterium]|nr:hypothetical protein [Acidobacteriota bacterium]
MITTMLNALNQTRQLGGSASTGVYDDGELEKLLAETNHEKPSESRGTQFLSPEMLSQILSGEFISSQTEETEMH